MKELFIESIFVFYMKTPLKILVVLLQCFIGKRKFNVFFKNWKNIEHEVMFFSGSPSIRTLDLPCKYSVIKYKQ